ncbi:MAG: PHP domain-containing protein [Brevinematales bacterium]|nr:PHP domain-containing protein [Brevinematales bacterium]
METNIPIHLQRNSDLHIHSTFSDGELSVSLIIKQATQKGIKYISITDHENINQNKEIEKLLKTTNLEILYIPGIEISTKYKNEDIHLVAYYNPEVSNKLEKIVQPIREYKQQQTLKTIELLKDTLEIPSHILKNGHRTINKMCIARYIYHNSNFQNIEKVYKYYFDKGSRYSIPNDYPKTEEIIKKLKSIGCVVGIAHPEFLKDWSKISYIEEFTKIGLDGIEIFHPLINKDLSTSILKFCQENNLLPLGGSDFHGYDTKRKELGLHNTFSSSAEKIIKILELKY